MIFNSNTTALGASTIPMAEGYDCSFGVGLALVESARNDLTVFKAMVQADYREMAICKESAGYVQEGEIIALQEAVGGGIFKKIAELFKKLVAKIKAIFHNFMAKINGLRMKDKELVKKYQSELARKRNLDKLEVKFRKPTKDISTISAYLAKVDNFEESKGWEEDSWKRVLVYLNKKNVDTIDEFVKETIDDALEDQDTVELKEVGGWREMASVITNSKDINDTNKEINKLNTRLEKLVNEYDKKAKDAAKASNEDRENKDKQDLLEDANKAYDMSLAYQTAIIGRMNALQQIMTIHYKQCKAAFMKAVAANEKKLEESAVYLDAVAEAAEEEVENVIQSALSDEEISDLSAASTNVKDGDISDDPDKLTYGPNCYTDNANFDKADGCIDADVTGGGKVEESYFSKLFY